MCVQMTVFARNLPKALGSAELMLQGASESFVEVIIEHG